MTLREILVELKKLREVDHIHGGDQTVRTRAIKLCFPATPDMNETARFLEFMIDEVETALLIGQTSLD